ncbi:hypothetical protein KKC88_00955 [Patescibacteria group bacterium]|nr:hypothetical protein [Patescibacteria group bacterium]MBU1673328.1 hypothetical protein [Patescibacteria group bacterium]MBU1963553.1 hypothetical protein [Patescibacteria group bacterium]
MAQEKEPNLDSLPEVHHEVDAEKAGIFINAKDTIIAIKKEIAGLDKREAGLEEAVQTMQDEGEAEPEIVESAVEAEEASVLRIEDRKEQLEGRKEELEKLRKLRNKVLLGMGALSGMDAGILALDRIGKFTGDEKGGLLLDHDERIELIHKKTKLIKFASKVAKPFMPGWGKALLVGGDKVWDMTDTLNEKYETALKNGEKVTFKDTGGWAMEEMAGIFKEADLKDPKKIEELGGYVVDFGKDLGGSAGAKFETIGGFIQNNSEKASDILIKMFSSIKEGDYKMDDFTEEVMQEYQKLEKAEEEEIAAAA